MRIGFLGTPIDHSPARDPQREAGREAAAAAHPDSHLLLRRRRCSSTAVHLVLQAGGTCTALLRCPSRSSPLRPGARFQIELDLIAAGCPPCLGPQVFLTRLSLLFSVCPSRICASGAVLYCCGVVLSALDGLI